MCELYGVTQLHQTTSLRDRDNVLPVVTDYTGHDQNNVGSKGTQNPRGILGATLIGEGNFTSWRIQGNAGGEKNIDAVLGLMNEGGLYGPKSASKSSPLDGVSGAEGCLYPTTFKLKLDKDLDVPIGLQLGALEGAQTVVQVFMNGYQFGHYLTSFPSRQNTLAISMWALTDAGAKLDKVELVAYGKYRSGLDFNQDWSYLQPGWKDRS
ncbi:beta galactosidase jelly roll domain-containing protein [Aspergillus novofumigatus IBT 16806]|uniref:Beta-galactosidase jelly roll domain-containing protein n=1 Tax=Aspergillus novofumigatus (strain IBT 16806) TaxID=1392255 RepID=A0A2I1C7J5_ASPN1|nr:uncharacterized protein P174DRAFT_430567 [Aspergillus novofumigatus IBT 16806]PKX93565.1 hypothetical protein P174DRAFT_430567 [Aspergillus novofumigatus IBT 16806]